jgi:hypothetical protein
MGVVGSKTNKPTNERTNKQTSKQTNKTGKSIAQLAKERVSCLMTVFLI